MMSLKGGIYKIIHMNLYTRQKKTNKKYMVNRGEGGNHKLGVWD